jgi:hypothetical protein
MPADKGATKQAQQIKAAAARKHERERANAASLAERISALNLVFTARAADTGRLFGSITASDIAEAMEKKLGAEFNKRQITLEHPLRDLGTHQVPVHLLSDVVPPGHGGDRARGRGRISAACSRFFSAISRCPTAPVLSLQNLARHGRGF